MSHNLKLTSLMGSHLSLVTSSVHCRFIFKINKSSKNPCFLTTISSQLTKQPFDGLDPQRYSILIITLNLDGISNMGSLLSIVVKLKIYKDSDVGNLRKFEYFNNYFRHLRNM